MICVGFLPLTTVAQCDSIDGASPAAVKEEVERFYNKSPDAMQSTMPSGVKVTTWMPPGDSRGEIKCLGAAAVPAIDELLRSDHRSFGQLVALRMLGWIGGPEIVPPLAWVLSRSDDFSTPKSYALESLSAARR